MGVITLEELELEWVQLIFEAKEIGLSIGDVREFLLSQLHETKIEFSLK